MATELILIALLLIAGVLVHHFVKKAQARRAYLVIPERFVVFDLETTGLKPESHEIIEIGAIRVYRDRTEHDTYQSLIKPKRKIPKKITEITGITQEMVDAEGRPISDVLSEFLEFVGSDRLVAFNADFDVAFLNSSLNAYLPSRKIVNPVSCALKMARKAWPGLKSYKLSELAKIGSLSGRETHRALADCQRTMIVYGAAVRATRRAS